ncbi:MAG: lipopolysaccharide biosynthesis protein [Pseudomonadota bacterium]
MLKQSAIKNMRAGKIFSIVDFLLAIWYSRWLVVTITGLMIVCGLTWSLVRVSYQSQGLFQFGGVIPTVSEMDGETARDKDKDKEQGKEKEKESMPGISLADFRRFAGSYATVERFNEFVRDQKLESVPGINDLRREFTSRDGISRIVEPIYTFVKLEATGRLTPPKDGNTNVLGLRFNYTHPSPEIAQKMAQLLGRYTMDSIVYQIYQDEVGFKISELKARVTKLDSTIIKQQLQQDAYRQQVMGLKEIIARNPQAAAPGTRQVVTITEDTARYLPPMTLLMTAEVLAAESNQDVAKIKRELEQTALLLKFYEKAKSRLDATKSGETYLRNLESVKEDVFKGRNLGDNVVRQAYNMITLDNLNAIDVYLNKSRFIAGPSLPSYPTARPAVAVAVSMILGLLLSITFVVSRKRRHDKRMRLSI